MRTALFLLLLLAIAAIPGSLVPQRSSDPNGVLAWKRDDPELFEILDRFQLFDTFSSIWFSSIYLLLFISLIGCILPRTQHHLRALRQPPPRNPPAVRKARAFRAKRNPG
ncbi:cytochrome c biogenesis protein ResB [Pontimonas sp.]|nr:cytochrome c biogenesis protein ResB [Pontimonas sp.]